jgi:hypothetical protein
MGVTGQMTLPLLMIYPDNSLLQNRTVKRSEANQRMVVAPPSKMSRTGPKKRMIDRMLMEKD